MATPMPASPFLNSGTPPSPAVPDTAGAYDQPPVAPAGTKPDFAKALPSSQTAESAVAVQAACPGATAVPFDEPTSRCTEPHEGAGALGCLTAEDEALYWQLRRADSPFTRDLAEIPDPHALFDAIEPPPLFLQRQA